MLTKRFTIDLEIPEGFIPFPKPFHWNVRVKGFELPERIFVSFDITDELISNPQMFIDLVTKRLIESFEINSACTSQFIKVPINDFGIVLTTKYLQMYLDELKSYYRTRGKGKMKVFFDDFILIQRKKTPSSSK
jgi:hypothetical protein